ncbi:MAG: ferredoxin [Mycobacterium sp.]
MKVIVDQDKCVSSGQCVLNSAVVFDQREDDGVVVLLTEHPPADQEDNARKAAAACPAQAISVEE